MYNLTLYGTSQLRSSQRQTPNDQMSTFSLQGSFLITSGAIQATVPAKLMQVDRSPPQVLLVPKSLILITSLRPIKTLKRRYKNIDEVGSGSA